MVELNRKTLRDLDWPVLIAPIALTLFGCLGIFSSAPGTDFWKKQLVALTLGVIGACVFAFTDYRKIMVEVSPFLYAGSLFLLILVLTPLGATINGNRAWLRLPGTSLQPSELAKVATILMLARYISQKREQGLSLKDIIILGAIVILPVVLIILEKDTGTALTYIPILGVFLFLGGMRKTLVAASIAAGVVGLLAVYPHLKPYQKERIIVIIDPSKANPRGYGYQTMQSVIAVGSGGVLGKGITHGTQGRLGFLPYAYSDFIGASLAEETGLIGILFILALYSVFIWRLCLIALGSRDRAGALMVMGFVGLFMFHIACNLGMVVGLMPIMGIPLPLMSLGGTSIISVFACIGLALSVRLRRFVN